MELLYYFLTLTTLCLSAMLLVANNLRPELKEKYLAWPWHKMADFAFKHVKGGK